MTVTDLDPPQSPLRLVASTGTPTGRDHRYRAGAQLGREARSLFRQVLADALRSGPPVNADALRVILAVKQANGPGPLRRFTATSIWQLMFVDVVSWCRARHLQVPADAVQALRALIYCLDTHDMLTDDSDPLTTLVAAIDECTGGGWTDPEAAPLPGRRQRSVRSHRGPKRT